MSTESNEKVGPVCPECGESSLALEVRLEGTFSRDPDVLIGSWSHVGDTVYVVDTDEIARQLWDNAELQVECQNDECGFHAYVDDNYWEHGTKPKEAVDA